MDAIVIGRNQLGQEEGTRRHQSGTIQDNTGQDRTECSHYRWEHWRHLHTFPQASGTSSSPCIREEGGLSRSAEGRRSVHRRGRERARYRSGGDGTGRDGYPVAALPLGSHASNHHLALLSGEALNNCQWLVALFALMNYHNSVDSEYQSSTLTESDIFCI